MLNFLPASAVLLMGLTLGLVGGGGAILTVPILTVLLGVPPEEATRDSLGIVAAAAALGAWLQHRRGMVRWRTAFSFAIPSALASAGTRGWILPSLPESWRGEPLLLVFSAVMVWAGIAMLRKPKSGKAPGDSTSRGRTVGAGVFVGGLSGLLGAGGGFLIVPALTQGLGLAMAPAVGTSLAVITLTTGAGFAAGALLGSPVNLARIAGVILLAWIGMGLGTFLNRRVPAEKLKKGFGVFLVLFGLAYGASLVA